MKKIIMLLALVLSSALYAENLLENADFSQVKKGLAVGWKAFGAGKVVFPENSKSVTLTTVSSEKKPCSLRQSVAKKVLPGKKYMIECQVRSSDLKAAAKSDYGIFLINRNWKGSVGVRRFKIFNDNKWRTMRRTVTIPEHWSSVTAVISLYGTDGTLEVSNFKITEVK